MIVDQILEKGFSIALDSLGKVCKFLLQPGQLYKKTACLGVRGLAVAELYSASPVTLE
jgi:hypothetical protein